MKKFTRRDAIRTIGAGSAGLLVGGGVIRGQGGADILVAGRPAEILVSSDSAWTVRLTVRGTMNNKPAPMPITGALTREDTTPSGQRVVPATRVRAGDLPAAETGGWRRRRRRRSRRTRRQSRIRARPVPTSGA